MPPEDENRDGPRGANTWMVIPYFDGDVGRRNVERPLPPGKGVSWRCSSILVDGVPGNTAFRRGVPLRIAVVVTNWGAGVLPAPALVRLWWSDPTLTFVNPKPIGQTTVVVQPGGAPVQTGEFSYTFPAGVSDHVCLLGQVSAPLDGGPGVPDPHLDRHWAQLNLIEQPEVPPGGEVVFPVLLANPFAEPSWSEVTIEPMPPEEAEHLGRERGRDIRVDAAAIDVEVRDPDGMDLRRTELAPHETRRAEVTVSLPPDEGARGLVLVQHLTRGEETALTGTLGVLIAPSQ